ncbi:MAG: hypothetical protein ACOX3G_00780 [Armatimonadota bacterium]
MMACHILPKWLRIVLGILGGCAIVLLAESIPVFVTPIYSNIDWLSLISAIMLSAAFSGIAGRYIVYDAWGVLAFGPILYYGGMSVLLRIAEPLWGDLHLPLAVIAACGAGFVGAFRAEFVAHLESKR